MKIQGSPAVIGLIKPSYDKTAVVYGTCANETFSVNYAIPHGNGNVVKCTDHMLIASPALDPETIEGFIRYFDGYHNNKSMFADFLREVKDTDRIVALLGSYLELGSPGYYFGRIKDGNVEVCQRSPGNRYLTLLSLDEGVRSTQISLPCSGSETLANAFFEKLGPNAKYTMGAIDIRNDWELTYKTESGTVSQRRDTEGVALRIIPTE